MPDRELAREFKGYELILTIAGPHHRNTISIEGATLEELEATTLQINGVFFERYAGEMTGEYTEVRSDHVVERRVQAVWEETLLDAPDEPQFDARPDVDISAMGGRR